MLQGNNRGTKTAGLPVMSITGSTDSAGDHTHTRGTMNITGSTYIKEAHGKYLGLHSNTGCITGSDTGSIENPDGGGDVGGSANRKLTIDASKNWTGETSSAGGHSHTITITGAESEIYGKSTTVQPPACLTYFVIKY